MQIVGAAFLGGALASDGFGRGEGYQVSSSRILGGVTIHGFGDKALFVVYPRSMSSILSDVLDISQP